MRIEQAADDPAGTLERLTVAVCLSCGDVVDDVILSNRRQNQYREHLCACGCGGSLEKRGHYWPRYIFGHHNRERRGNRSRQKHLDNGLRPV